MMENGQMQDDDVYDPEAGELLNVAMEEEAGGAAKKVRTSFNQVAVPMKEEVKLIDRSLPTTSFAHRSLLLLSLILFLVSVCPDVSREYHAVHITSLGSVDCYRGEVIVSWCFLTRSF